MKKIKSPPPERDATAAEMKALGHPLRWRILRETLDRGMTNKQLAERLGRDPGTVLHHVRVLVDAGFLASEDVRSGKRGALERPYRSTGKSWRIRLKQDSSSVAAILDAVREEVIDGGVDAVVALVRLGARLSAADAEELRVRLVAIADEFEQRDDPLGQPVGMLLLAHWRRP